MEILTVIVGSDCSLRGQCEQPARTITSEWENYHLCRPAAADTETVACMEQQQICTICRYCNRTNGAPELIDIKPLIGLQRIM